MGQDSIDTAILRQQLFAVFTEGIPVTGHPIVTTLRGKEGTENSILSRSGKIPTHSSCQLPPETKQILWTSDKLWLGKCSQFWLGSGYWKWDILFSYRVLISEVSENRSFFTQVEDFTPGEREMGSTDLQLCDLTWLIYSMFGFLLKINNPLWYCHGHACFWLCSTFPGTTVILKQRFEWY